MTDNLYFFRANTLERIMNNKKSIQDELKGQTKAKSKMQRANMKQGAKRSLLFKNLKSKPKYTFISRLLK